MTRPKKKIEPEKELTHDEIESKESFDLESQSLEDRAIQVFKDKPNFIRTLKRIAYYTAKVGLSLKESCLLLDVDVDWLEEEMKTEPIIEKIIKVKELEYKKDLLYTLSSKARQGDDKLALWLLENKYPDEYGQKKNKGGGEGAGDIMFEAIRFIQKNGDNAPLINTASGNAMIVKRKTSSQGTVERINDILIGAGKE